VFEQFTPRARQVVVLAQDEARKLNHNYIGTEHILLGLLREEEGLAARVLGSLAVTVEEVRSQVAQIVGPGDEVTTGQIPFTPRAKKVLELALREATSLKHGYIGTEHVLLGLVRVNEGVAAQILLEFDADAEKVRTEVIRMFSGGELPPARPRRGLTPRERRAAAAEPGLAAELERVRNEKEDAIEAQEFERAAKLREEERKLTHELIVAAGAPAQVSDQADAASRSDRLPLLLAIVLAAGAFPLGLIIGWLIWG
jgi:ATP-dependent Clp protease ATP-binding subunit ClpC